MSDGAQRTERVHIQMQRVQTWLFAVPRLRAMVGANALLGEALRISLPRLARDGAGWTLAGSTEQYPGIDANDPLSEHDDPSTDAEEGILARDGGHFEAQFSAGAAAFAEAAGSLLRSRLPGLRYSISIDRKPFENDGQVHLSNELPVLAPCEWTGGALASTVVIQGPDGHTVSLEVARRHAAAKDAEAGTALDLASLLAAKTRLAGLNRAQELQDLVGDGYLALVHADGNGVGGRAPEGDAARARFFHRNRVLLRRALEVSINAHCGDEGQAPLVPLMLGGDDLLLVCRAEIALPLVVTLCEALASFQTDDAQDFELTLGVGVVIAKRAIPIYRLHEVAEQLASSAKRRFRGLVDGGAKGCSVIDWAVYSASWVDDPAEVRARDWVCGVDVDHRILSQRPVDVLGDGLGTLRGLQRAARQIAHAPRSQLRYLVEQLPRGRVLAELAFAELSKEARGALGRAGVDGAWRRTRSDGPWITELLDLVEIFEIERLGRSGEHGRGKRETAHG